MKLNNKNGITLVSLVIMIIVLIILASITVYGGSQIIKKANLENLKTNMLLIQAEAKSSVEEFNFRKFELNGTETEITAQMDVLKIEELIGTKVTDETKEKVEKILENCKKDEEKLESELENCYILDEDKLKKINVNIKVPEGEYYIVEYDFENISAEIYYTKGYNYNGETLYSLTQLNEVKY